MMYVYMDRLHLLIWYSVQFCSFFYIGISVADLPQMIFDVILFLIGKQVHSWIWYILKSLFGRNLFFRSLSVLVDARTSFLFLYHYIEHVFVLSTAIIYLFSLYFCFSVLLSVFVNQVYIFFLPVSISFFCFFEISFTFIEFDVMI